MAILQTSCESNCKNRILPGFYGSECKGARFFGGSFDGFDSKVRLESDSENLDRKKLCQVFLKKKMGKIGNTLI